MRPKRHQHVTPCLLSTRNLSFVETKGEYSMKRQIPDPPCNQSAESAEFAQRGRSMHRRSTESSLRTSYRAATTGQAAVLHVREMLHLANLVFALIESKTGGDEELTYFLRLGERALSRAGDLLI